MGLLMAILGIAASAWGDKQQRNRLQRIADTLQAKADEVRADIESGYADAQTALTTGYEDAEQALKDGFDAAHKQLENGNDEAATQILKGLGLSTEEINKWSDVAAEGMEWVVDFGKEGIAPARTYMAEMTEAIMNPDAIWQSDVYLNYKAEVMDSMKNALSGSPGVMSGNTWAAMQDRLGKDALTVRQNQITNLQSGYQQAMQQVGVGTNAQQFLANLRQAQGVNLANLISPAYNQLGINRRDLGTALSGLETSEAAGLANLATGQGTALANLGIGKTTDLANLDLATATQLANIKLAGMQENPWTNLGTTAMTLGGQEIQQGNLWKFGDDRTKYGTTNESTAMRDQGNNQSWGLSPIQVGQGRNALVPTYVDTPTYV
jgi:hypothetical protein